MPRHFVRHLIPLLGLLMAFMPIFSTPTPSIAQVTTTVTLATVDVGVAETTWVEGRIACGVAEGCSGFSITVRFDRELVRVQTAEIGPYLGAQVFEAQNMVDNAAGTVQLSAAALQPIPAGAENILFRLEVGGLYPGQAALEVAEIEVVNPNGETLPASGGAGAANVYETGKIPFFSPPVNEWEVAFVSERDGNPEIYSIMANGSGLRRLTENDVLDGGPTWSPDGARIAFHSQRDGGLDIYVMNADGSGVQRLTDHGATDYAPAWSPDGGRIAFVSERNGNADIFVMNADGSNVQQITSDQAQETQPVWSPDGSKIAYASNAGGTYEIVVINADGTAPQQITNLFGANGWHPAYNGIGTLVALSIERDNLADIYTMTPAGQNVTRLTPESDQLTSTDWSPDSRYLAHMSTQTGITDLYVLDTARDYLFRLTEDPDEDYDPDWRPVGESGPCAIRTSDPFIQLRVGPGLNRTVFTYVPVNQDVLVTGQITDGDGILWYEIDKTQIIGGEQVNGLFVRASEVSAVGACGSLPPSEGTPIIPDVPRPTPGDGSWGPCGSCDTCGHPGECVTSPSGECLWDPATCGPP
ncbi:MAG: PD40 domain-containing protein, partial [Anaerolineae bacterium]|nr:PD40 domain-containing protein [Anaerolineae bacterium]